MGLIKEAVGKRGSAWAAALICCAFLSSCSPETERPPMPFQADLVVYTVQEEGIYEPVVKEFEERTGLSVKVETGSSKELLKKLEGRGRNVGCGIWHWNRDLRRGKGALAGL